MSIVLVFDCETTGLLPKKTTDLFPRMTQLSFTLYDTEKRKLLELYSEYVSLPADILIPPMVTEITGITRELLDHRGMDIKEILQAFYKAYQRADIVVAHNISFDEAVLIKESASHCNELERAMLQKEKLTFCTMKTSVDLCCILATNSRGSYKKYPKLAELYNHLFGYVPENLHDARTDVLCCLRCYLKISEDITIPEEEFMELLGKTPLCSRMICCMA